mmetsp:Transcript_23061/g.27037  ORF Transcript_23061/g.27037 Transcript_23061/m.27037 type:complete len:133 (+) Transcript_23061:21-419(+)|eukprot:CAMPEP_0170452568 /NCGR_PEP_ID=MMETSP0123-20130129/1420_1 /TAXON_ID=182087 /ORGANISM="Favella ehrenbergii, Strain Fehren 1" /LENGTH=132 /DNA_ID=CAMNT_0010714611 /DNA_START=14 /DNA_END=412 /DNA_ORIENTATION=-
MAAPSSKASQNAKLRVTQQLLAEEYQNMQAGTHSVLATSENINRAKGSYDKYSDKIRRSKLLVDEIIKAEQWDEKKLRYSFNCFTATVVYLLLKRFFLWEFLFAAYYLVFIFGHYLIDFVLLPLVSFGGSQV